MDTSRMQPPPKDTAPVRFVDKWGRHWKQKVDPQGRIEYVRVFDPADKARLDALNTPKPATVEKADGRDKGKTDEWGDIR